MEPTFIQHLPHQSPYAWLPLPFTCESSTGLQFALDMLIPQSPAGVGKVIGEHACPITRGVCVFTETFVTTTFYMGPGLCSDFRR